MTLNKIEKKIFYFIKTYHIFKKYDKILIGVSGGKDSVVLLNSLIKISKLNNYEIFAAHFNHKYRKNSDIDELFVKKLCAENNIPLFIKSADVKKISLDRKESFEECARKLRYEFFFDILKENNLNKIATAHNLSDLVETIIFRISRGSGIYGSCGMEPVNDLLTKPMLTVTLKEAYEYVTINNIEYVEDETNDSLKYTRNRIRHKILPELSEINEKFENNYLKFAQNIWKYRHHCETLFYERTKKVNDSLVIELKNDFFDSEILRLFFLKNSYYPPNMEETEKIIRMRNSGTRIFNNYILRKQKNNIVITFNKGSDNFARKEK